jgi:hypothetical protein
LARMSARQKIVIFLPPFTRSNLNRFLQKTL